MINKAVIVEDQVTIQILEARAQKWKSIRFADMAQVYKLLKWLLV